MLGDSQSSGEHDELSFLVRLSLATQDLLKGPLQSTHHREMGVTHEAETRGDLFFSSADFPTDQKQRFTLLLSARAPGPGGSCWTLPIIGRAMLSLQRTHSL